MTIVEALRLVRAFKWVLLGATVLGVLVMLALASRQPTLYAASSSGFVKVGNASSAGEEMSNLALAEDKAQLYVQLVGTTGVAERVVDDLGIDVPPGSIVGRFSAAVGSANLLTITATGTTPEEARDLANSVVQAVSDEASEIENAGRPAGAPRVDLVRIVPLEQAGLPGAPYSPDYRSAALKGGAGGLAAAIALLLLRRAVDRRIRSSKEAEEATGAPVMGVIPREPALSATDRGIHGDLGRASEAFRSLRTNLRFADVDHPPRRIVVTSALAGEGKSTVSANLARLLAHAGERVVLIDADLRRPMVATTFSIDGHVGLTQVLAGDVGTHDAIVESGLPHLSLLPAGRIPPNPSELLGSQRMSQLIDELARDHIVILDAPPLLPVTDAGLLSAFTDGALLVQAAGKAQYEQGQHCRRILDQVGSRLLGVVLNKAPVKGASAIAYGEGYGGYGYAAYASDYTARESADAGERPSGGAPLSSGRGGRRRR